MTTRRYPPKYLLALQIASVNGMFFTNSKSATLYDAVRKLGYVWNEAQGKWVRTER